MKILFDQAISPADIETGNLCLEAQGLALALTPAGGTDAAFAELAGKRLRVELETIADDAPTPVTIYEVYGHEDDFECSRSWPVYRSFDHAKAMARAAALNDAVARANALKVEFDAYAAACTPRPREDAFADRDAYRAATRAWMRAQAEYLDAWFAQRGINDPDLRMDIQYGTKNREFIVSSIEVEP